MEKLNETPFIASDLIDPGHPEPESEIYTNTIPIRTWSRGKTLNEVMIDDNNDNNSTDGIISMEGDLFSYFPQVTVEEDAEDESEDIDDESGRVETTIKRNGDNDDYDNYDEEDDFESESDSDIEERMDENSGDITREFEESLKKKFPEPTGVDVRQNLFSPGYVEESETITPAGTKLGAISFQDAFYQGEYDEFKLPIQKPIENMKLNHHSHNENDKQIKDHLRDIMLDYNMTISKLSKEPKYDSKQTNNSSRKGVTKSDDKNIQLSQSSQYKIMANEIQMKNETKTNRRQINHNRGHGHIYSHSHNDTSSVKDKEEVVEAKEEEEILSQPKVDMSIFSYNNQHQHQDDPYIEDGYEDDYIQERESEYYDGVDYSADFMIDDDIYNDDPPNHSPNIYGNKKNIRKSLDNPKYAAIAEIYNKVPKIMNIKSRKVKASGYGPVDPQKRKQDQIWRERVRNFDAKSKMKETLAEIALKKKMEEEAVSLELLKEETRKKKFRENLERAIQAKVGEESITMGQPGFLAPTKAFELQAQILAINKRKNNELVMNSEDMMKSEEEKREKIIALRRKFKEKHRLILEQLTKRNKEIERKMEEDQELEVKRKEKYQKKLLQMLHMSDGTYRIPPSDLNHDGSYSARESLNSSSIDAIDFTDPSDSNQYHTPPLYSNSIINKDMNQSSPTYQQKQNKFYNIKQPKESKSLKSKKFDRKYRMETEKIENNVLEDEKVIENNNRENHTIENKTTPNHRPSHHPIYPPQKREKSAPMPTIRSGEDLLLPSHQSNQSNHSNQPKRAAGSALSAIRSQRPSAVPIITESITPTNSNNNNINNSNSNHMAIASAIIIPSYEEFRSLEEDKLVAKEKRIANTKVYQDKMQSYLITLAEQKKKEENEKKRKEDRIKRRAYLLSVRIMSEANERKSMESEDKIIYRTLNDDKDTIRTSHYEKVVDKTYEKKNSEEKLERHFKSNNSYREKSKEKQRNKDRIRNVKEKNREEDDRDRNRLGGKDMDKDMDSDDSIEEDEKEEDEDENNNKNYQNNKVNHNSSIVIKQNPSKSSSATKLTNEMATNLISRLFKPNSNPKVIQTITTSSGEEVVVSSTIYRDYNDWKRKNHIALDNKVFCMTGWYPCVKQALLDRGWIFNSDPNSPYCDMKWTLKSIDITPENLLPWQLTNHFYKNMAITTKVGLLKSLQPLVWLADVTIADIFPRGYDLSNTEDMKAFMDDFRVQKAASILKYIYEDITGQSKPPQKSINHDDGDHDVNENKEKIVHSHLKPIKDMNSYFINKGVYEICCKVLDRMLRPLGDTYIDDADNSTHDTDSMFSIAITPLEWEIISTCDIFKKNKLSDEPMEPVDGFLSNNSNNYNNSFSNGDIISQNNISSKKRTLFDIQKARSMASESIQEMVPMSITILHKINHVLSYLLMLEGSQSAINGTGKNSNNLWIVKPAAKSRGRGISTFNDLSKLLKYIEAGTGSTNQWIVQKYMENPLIIAKRKFDLRQWVLVTDWNPLTIYFYDEFYARFSVDEYDTSEKELENSFIHLVNNSIGKNSDNFTKIVQTEYGVDLEGYMLTYNQFCEHIKNLTGDDKIAPTIQQKMKDIAKWSLMCASDMIEHRKNSWELYGFDYMIDNEYKPWLIEINSSPACDYSTKVTERYVQKALVEILSVVLDLRQWESIPKKTRGEKPNIGGWECIYRGPMLEKPIASLGVDMTLKGESCKIPIQRNQPLSYYHTTASSKKVGITQRITDTISPTHKDKDKDRNTSMTIVKVPSVDMMISTKVFSPKIVDITNKSPKNLSINSMSIQKLPISPRNFHSDSNSNRKDILESSPRSVGSDKSNGNSNGHDGNQKNSHKNKDVRSLKIVDTSRSLMDDSCDDLPNLSEPTSTMEDGKRFHGINNENSLSKLPISSSSMATYGRTDIEIVKTVEFPKPMVNKSGKHSKRMDNNNNNNNNSNNNSNNNNSSSSNTTPSSTKAIPVKVFQVDF